MMIIILNINKINNYVDSDYKIYEAKYMYAHTRACTHTRVRAACVYVCMYPLCMYREYQSYLYTYRFIIVVLVVLNNCRNNSEYVHMYVCMYV